MLYLMLSTLLRRPHPIGLVAILPTLEIRTALALSLQSWKSAVTGSTRTIVARSSHCFLYSHVSRPDSVEKSVDWNVKMQSFVRGRMGKLMKPLN